MNRQRFDWETIRAEYEAGATMGRLAESHGVNKSAISRRAAKEVWTQDVTNAVDRRVNAKVNGIGNTVDPVKKSAALDAAADRKVAVIERHRVEWEEHRTLINEAVVARDFNAAKLARITAEVIQIRQSGERKAWGIMDVDVRPRDAASGLNLNLIMRGNDGCKPESAQASE